MTMRRRALSKKTVSETVSKRKPPRSVDDLENTTAKLWKILDRVDRLSTLDNRAAEEILGYDENGVSH